MAPLQGDPKVTISLSNWVLGGSLIQVKRNVADREGNHRRIVSNKLAIKVDAEGNKVYPDGTVKKKEKPPEPKLEPPTPEPKTEIQKPEKVEEKPKETGILKKTQTKGGDEEEETAEKTCCGKCGKTLKSNGLGEKCKKHGNSKEGAKEGSKDKSKDESKEESKDESKEKAKGDSKDDKNGKKDKPEQNQRGGKSSFAWTDELDKKLLEMMEAEEKWSKIQSTLKTSKQNCLDRLAELRSKDSKDNGPKGDAATIIAKDDAAAIKAKNDATEAALEAALPKNNTNFGFGSGFGTGGGFDINFGGSDFGGDPLNKGVKSSWDSAAAASAPAAGAWDAPGKKGDDKQQITSAWDTPNTNGKTEKPDAGGDWNAGSAPAAPWTSHDAAMHTVVVPPAQPSANGWDDKAPAVPGSTGGGDSWDAPKAADKKTGGDWKGGAATGGSGSWDLKKKADTPKPAESKPSSGGWNDDNPHVNKPAATDSAPAADNWGGLGSALANDNAVTGDAWGSNTGGGGGGGDGADDAAWGSSDSQPVPGGWNSSDDNKFQDKPADTSVNTNSGNGWGGNEKAQNGGSTSWDALGGQSGGNPATSSWDTPTSGNKSAAPQNGNGGNNGGNKSQPAKQSGQVNTNWGGDGANDQKPNQNAGSGGQNAQGSQPQNGNGSNNWLNAGQGSASPSGDNWGGNISSKAQGSPEPSGGGWNSDNPFVTQNSPASSSGNNWNNNSNNPSNGPNGPQSQSGWDGNTANNDNPPSSSNGPAPQGGWNGNSGNGQAGSSSRGGNYGNNGNTSNSPPPSQNFNGGNSGSQWQGSNNSGGSPQGSGPNNTQFTYNNQGGQHQNGPGENRQKGGQGNWHPIDGKNSWQGPPPFANNNQGGQSQNGPGNNSQRGPNGCNYGPPNQGPPQNSSGNNQEVSLQNSNSNQGGHYQNGRGNNSQPNQQGTNGYNSHNTLSQNASPPNNGNGYSQPAGKGQGQTQPVNRNQGAYWQNGSGNNNPGPSNSGNGFVWIPGPPTSNNQAPPPHYTGSPPNFNGTSGYWTYISPPAPNANVGNNQGVQTPSESGNVSQGGQMQNTPPAQNTNGGDVQGGQGQAQPMCNGFGGCWQFNGPPQQNSYQGGQGPSQSTNIVPEGALPKYGPPPLPVPAPNNLPYQAPTGTFVYSQGSHIASPPQRKVTPVNVQVPPPPPPNANANGKWVWQGLSIPKAQPRQGSCGHDQVQSNAPSRQQPQATHCSHNHAAPAQNASATGRWIFEAKSASQAQAPVPSHTPVPCTHQASPPPAHTPILCTHQTPPPPQPSQIPNIAHIAHWTEHGMHNPHWYRPPQTQQHFNTSVPQHQQVTPDPGPKHVHFTSSTAGRSFSNGSSGHDIWSPHHVQPVHVHEQPPAPSTTPQPSVFEGSSGYAYNAPGTFPSSPKLQSQPPQPASKPHNNGCPTPPTQTPHLKPDSTFSQQDCELLEYLCARHTVTTFQTITSEFFNWTGRTLCPLAVERKFMDDGLL